MKIEIEYSEEDKKAAQALTDVHRAWITKTPEALSLLYDLDLLPEQIVLPINAMRMSVICDLLKALHDQENKTPDGQI